MYKGLSPNTKIVIIVVRLCGGGACVHACVHAACAPPAEKGSRGCVSTEPNVNSV